MLGCSTVCPNCKHEFLCCPSTQHQQQLQGSCCSARRSLHVLSGGGLIASTTTTTTLAPSQQQQHQGSPCPSPQVSPSVPLAFILPPLNAPLQPAAPAPLLVGETELQRLSDTVRALRQSGWYYEDITYNESHELLKGTALGTFLVRNSSDPKFLFTLSVQTERGPTSVRIYYVNGYFRLDAQAHLLPAMPMFPSVVELVLHYVEHSRLYRTNSQVWVDPMGKWYSSILLVKPLRKRQEAPSLKHFARLAVHRALRASTQPRVAMLPQPHTQLELPTSLVSYLSEYPFSI